MSKQTALVIVDAFPPVAHPTALRWWNLLRHLPEHGWNLIVLSRPHARYPLADNSLLELLNEESVRVEVYSDKKIPASSLVHNVKKNWPDHSISVHSVVPLKDESSKWSTKAYYRAKGLIERFDVDLIVAGGPPFATHRLAGKLSEDCEVPFVLDYQHHWSEAPQTKNHLYARSRGKSWEQDLLKRAQHIMVTTRNIKETLLQNHSFLEHNDVTIVPEMFDEALCEQARQNAISTPAESLHVVHAGVLVGNASHTPLLKAMAIVNKAKQHSVEFTHVGPLHKSEKKKIAKSTESEHVRHLQGAIVDLYKEIANADVLWLHANSEEDAQAQLGMYAGSGKPILFCVPEGESSRQLLANQAGVIVPNKASVIAEALQYCIELKQQGTRPTPKEEMYTQHNSALTAADVSRIMGLAMKM